MASEVASAYVTLTANTAGLTTGLAAAEAKVRGFAGAADASAARASKSFSAMGVAMKRGLIAGGIAAGLALGSAVKTAADFETELSALRSATNGSARDMDRLKEAALDLGAETKFSALEVAQAQTELGRAGMSVSQILGGSLRGSLALAAAGQMDLATASATIVDTMGQFSLSVSDAGHIADALAQSANATTADVGEMAAALENVGPVANSAGIGLDQTLVAMQLLANAGTKGAEAGTGFRAMITSLSNPSAKAAAKMRELNIEFYDAHGRFKDMDVVAGMLQRSFRGLTNEERNQAAATIAGAYGQKTLLSLWQQGAKAAREAERGLQRQGQAASMAATMNDNLQGKLEQLGGAIETIKIRVGSALIPLLSDAAVATAEWLDAIGDSKGLENFADGLADGLGEFADAAGEAWDVASPLFDQLGGIAEDAFSAVEGAAEGAAPVLLATGEAFGTVGAAGLAVVGPVMSAVDTIAHIPGVTSAATAGLVGLAAGFVAFRGINTATGIAESVTGFMRLVASLRAVPPAASVAIASSRALAAQSAQASVATMRANMISAASHASYVKAFTGGNTVAARSAVTAAQAQIQAQTRVAMISATSARTFSRTFAPAAATAAAQSSRLGAVMGALATRFPVTASAMGALASPAGIAALAIGGLVGGFVLLRSGMFQGASIAERQAAALSGVAAAARDADSALRGLNNATLNLKEANVQEEAAVLRLRSARQGLTQATRGMTSAERSQFLASDQGRQLVNQVEQAEVDLARARGRTADAAQTVRNKTLNAVAAQVRAIQTSDGSVEAAGREVAAYRNLTRAMGVKGKAGEELIRNFDEQVKAGASVTEKFDLIRTAVRRGADEMQKAGKTGLAEELRKVGDLDNSGLEQFFASYTAGMKSGLNEAQAFKKALAGIKAPKALRLQATDNISPKARAAKRAVDEIRQASPTQLQANDLISPRIPGIQAQIDGLRGKTVQVTVQMQYPSSSPNFYQAIDLLDGMKDRTVTATVRVNGSGELEAMERRVRAVSSGNVAGLRGKYGGGSLESLRSSVSGAGGLLIRANLDIANLPEVLAEARQAGVSIGGSFAATLETDRKELARLVGQSNTLISRIENLRSLTDQLGRAKTAASKAKGDERKQAQAEVERIKKQIAAAQKAYASLAGGASAPAAIAALNKRIAAQIAKLNGPAQELRRKAEEFRQAKEDFVEAFKTSALDQFDRETTTKLTGIAAAYQNGFRQIGNTFELIPGEFRKLEDRTAAAMKSLQGTLDRESKAIDAKYKAAGKSLDARAKELTAAEARLAAIRDEQSSGDIARNVTDAETALREAITKRMPESEVKSRMRAVEDARRAELIAGLEKTAEAERTAKDAQIEADRERLTAAETLEREAAQARFEIQQQRITDSSEAERLYLEAMLTNQQSALEQAREAERYSLEQSLTAWGNAFSQQQAIVGGNHASVLAQVRDFSTALERSGRKLGNDYADGLRKSFPAIRSAASDAAGIISRFLELHSPAKEGPLSNLDDWWGGFAKTLLSGANMSAADALVRAYSNPALGGAAAPASYAGPVSITVNVTDSTTVGMSREQARRVAQDIKPELDRIVGIRS